MHAPEPRNTAGTAEAPTPSAETGGGPDVRWLLTGRTGIVLILLFGAILLLLIRREQTEQQRLLQARFRTQATNAADTVANRISHSFAELHQGLRTLARIPAVRRSDERGEGLAPEISLTAQETYNDLASNLGATAMAVVEFKPTGDEPGPR